MKLLVVIDVQNDFVDGSLGTPEGVSIIPFVKEKIASFTGEIVYTMDTHNEDYLNTQEGRNLPLKHCIRGTEGWKIRDGVYKEGCKIFEKPGFGSSELIDYIRDLNSKETPESIEFIGICTDICVVTNVMMVKGNFPEIPLIVDSRCCAGVSPKAHENALATMKSCQVKIL